MYFVTFHRGEEEEPPMTQAKKPRIANQPKALVGAKRIAQYAFADESKWRWVYRLKDDLGLFYMRGRLCGRPATIDQRLRAREAASNAA
jgi:hypothetical protein